MDKLLTGSHTIYGPTGKTELGRPPGYNSEMEFLDEMVEKGKLAMRDAVCAGCIDRGTCYTGLCKDVLIFM